jgi:dipeptidyl aminopeptidase/acylaminoacyl peptidase
MLALRLFTMLVLVVSASVSAQDNTDARAFGARAEIEQMSISPDGTKVAYVGATKGQGSALFIADLVKGGASKGVISADGEPERISHCNWVSNTRLVCQIYAQIYQQNGDYNYASRLVALNSDGSGVKGLSKRQGNNAEYFVNAGGNVIDFLPGQDGSVLLGRHYAPESAVSSLINSKAEGYGVDRVDTVSLAAKRVVAPIPMAWEYISDGQGNVRIRGLGTQSTGGYDDRFINYTYRAVDGKKWEKLSRYDYIAKEGFNPIAIDPKENAVYGFDKLDGRLAVYKVALDGSLTRTLVLARPDVDVDSVVTIGRARRVVGVSFTTEKRQAYYFDPEIKNIVSLVAKALGGNRSVQIVEASEDETRFLLWAGADTDPGSYYVFNKTNKQLELLLANRPALAGYKLGEVKSVKVKAADGAEIPAYLTLPAGSTGKGLPAIVMPHGGPGARDEWGFDWLSQFFASRGYAVLQPNFRGSTGYGDSWFVKNGFQSWKIAIGDVNDSGRWLVANGIADPSKLAVVGWSYGGYAALQSGVTAPDLFKAIIAIAPVTDLGILKQESIGYSNLRVTEAVIGSGPHIAEGSPARHAERIMAPVLLVHGDRDRNVGVNQTHVMAGKLKSAGKAHEVLIFPKRDHYLEDSAMREAMLSKADAFLRSSLRR